MKNRIKFWRLQLQAKEGRIITQVEFAAMCGVSRGAVNRWEQQRDNPTLETLVVVWDKLREFYPEINLQDLLER
jgi:DNA-binding XRE family transcriptional regulator